MSTTTDPAASERPRYVVTVLSAVMLRFGREASGDGLEVFAARAGVDLDLVEGIEAGTRPAWDVPGPELTRITSVMGPVEGEAFWTAVACELLLTNLLRGNNVAAGVVAQEALGDPSYRGMARALLRWAVCGEGKVTGPLLPLTVRIRVRRRAAELAGSRSPDSWVGAELLSMLGGEPVTGGRL